MVWGMRPRISVFFPLGDFHCRIEFLIVVLQLGNNFYVVPQGCLRSPFKDVTLSTAVQFDSSFLLPGAVLLSGNGTV